MILLGIVLIENKNYKKLITNGGNNLNLNDYQIIDCKKYVLCPGLIDICAHLREPGEEYKENIESASNAAISGGITSLFVCQIQILLLIKYPL